MNNLDEETKNYIFDAINSSSKWKLPTTGESFDNVYDEIPTIKTVGVIGGGTMGAGIAIALSNSVYKVILVEIDDKFLNDAKNRIKILLNREKEYKRLNEDNFKKIVENISYTVDFKLLSEADLVIEAVFECMQTKKKLFEKLKPILKKNCIVGSNTSSLDIDELANSIKPFNFVGIHFFNPSHVVKTIEIVYGNTTKGVSVAVGFEISARMNKYPILVKTCPGFLFNRLLFVYIGIVSELINTYGLYPSKIDEIFKKFGFLMGPLTMCDMNGLDVMDNVSREVNFKLNELEKWLVNKGDYGRKTGRGYYIYSKKGKKMNNKEVEEKINSLKSKNIEEVGLINDKDIVEFVLFPYINEIFKCLEDGIVSNFSHIDLIILVGLGWPLKTGGPVRWAKNQIGLKKIVEKLVYWYSKYQHPSYKVCDFLYKEAMSDQSTIKKII
uniref:3-hydroxyacyl-CoA dehydrogenase n=1 Tax=Strongyloides venezuelensis TaxID=75913 RepID=A0A0K0FLH8_STRVS